MFVWDLKMLELQHVENFGKGVGRNILEIRLPNFENLEHGISIYQEPWNGNLVI